MSTTCAQIAHLCDSAPGASLLPASCTADSFAFRAGGGVHQLVREGYGDRGCSEYFSRGRPVWHTAGAEPVGGQLSGAAIAVHEREQEARASQDGAEEEGAPALGSGCLGGHAGGLGRSAAETSEARTAAGAGRVSGMLHGSIELQKLNGGHMLF